MSQLPEDSLLQILSLLPLSSLRRCQLLCRSIAGLLQIRSRPLLRLRRSSGLSDSSEMLASTRLLAAMELEQVLGEMERQWGRDEVAVRRWVDQNT